MTALEAGTVMKDGSIYVGISPQTGNMLFVMPLDAPMLLNFKEAAAGAEALNAAEAFSHGDWRLPVRKELDVIFESREKGALAGTFNEAGTHYGRTKRAGAAGWYRSSDWGSLTTTRCHFFKDGSETYFFHTDPTSVRYVRDGESPGLPEPPPYVTPDRVTELQNRVNKLSQQRKQKMKLP